ncbi:flagellar hook-length control protein FliK [Leptospira inadai serovar Lyme str. 10]|uniref:Flagellar hook-length control protein FliK n=2 Tax=Leptospira inadai serovar Lyme TaxID=293084 RepID=V6HCG8_9LEPT|nr:flagellar hook-length control protein FliK [Leptospira inadai serovar Lyme str. 10]
MTNSESKSAAAASEKSPQAGLNFMDLMKSIQLRSQQALEEGQKPEGEIKSNQPEMNPSEAGLFDEIEEEQKDDSEIEHEDSEEIVSAADEEKEFAEIYSILNSFSESIQTKDTQFSKTIKNPEKSEKIKEEDSELDWESETEEEPPFIVRMTAFLQSLEPKKVISFDKDEEIPAAQLQATRKAVKPQAKEETPAKDSKQEQTDIISLAKSEDKKNVKEVRTQRPTEKESLESGLRNLEEVHKFSKPANEEKSISPLREVGKENPALESENVKITRDKKSESLSQISKSSSIKVPASEDSSSKGDSTGKDRQNSESSYRQGNETTFSLLKAGMGMMEKEAASVSSSFDKGRSTNSSSLDKGVVRENFQRLVQSAKLHIVENGKSEATLRLNPQELGRVSLRISVEDDRVQGRIFVESEEVKRMFTGDLEQLKRDFKDQGLVLESLLVEVEESGLFSFFDGDSSGARDRETEGLSLGSDRKNKDSESLSQLDSTEISQTAEKNTERRLNVLV